jgi:predicted porin
MKSFIGCMLIVAGVYSGNCMAQSQVTVYGLVDTGIEYVTNANSAGNGVAKIAGSTGEIPSRIGFRGVEDLGGGLQAKFVLESGFTPDTGTLGQGNRMFGRQAWVGLGNEYGTVSVGRLQNMSYYVWLKGDILGPNIFGNADFDPYLANARSDNAIGYMGTFGPYTIGATYSLGRDTATAGGPAATNCPGEIAGNAQACRQTTALLQYEGSVFGVATAYDTMNGGTAASGGGLTQANYKDRRIALNAYVMVGGAKVVAGLQNRKTSTATDVTSNIYLVGVSYPLSAQWILDGQINRYKINEANTASTLSVARVNYNLSKRTTVYGQVGYMQNSANAANSLDPGGTVGVGLNQTGFMAGIRHSF